MCPSLDTYNVSESSAECQTGLSNFRTLNETSATWAAFCVAREQLSDLTKSSPTAFS